MFDFYSFWFAFNAYRPKIKNEEEIAVVNGCMLAYINNSNKAVFMYVFKYTLVAIP